VAIKGLMTMAVTVFHSSLNIVNKLYDYKQSYNYKHTRPNTTPRRVSPSDTEILFSLNIMHPSVEKKIDRVWDCYTAIGLCYQPANVYIHLFDNKGPTGL